MDIEHHHTVAELINEWPTRQDLADAVSCKVDAVHKWARTGRIPSALQHRVLVAAASRGIEWATPAWMVEVHARKAA